MPEFTTDWAGAFFQSMEILFPEKVETPMTCLEVGSFEGMGSLKIVETLCSHPESRLYCLDPWDDVYTINDTRSSRFDKNVVGQYGRFIKNTESEPKIIPVRGYSNLILPTLDVSLDFAYIDGDHSFEQVYQDAVNVLPKMKKGGIILFDDYEYPLNDIFHTKEGIRKFVNEYENGVEIILKNYQLGVKVI